MHYTTPTATVLYTLDYTTLYYTTAHNTKSTLHYTTLRCTTLRHTTLITPHHNYNCNYNYTTLNYNYNYTTTTTPPHPPALLFPHGPVGFLDNDFCRLSGECLTGFISPCLRDSFDGVYLPVVSRKAVAKASKIGNLWERLVVVNHGWQSESTDGPKGG